jgi:hypothetical protein
MADHQEPFADVVPVEGGFSIPELKWRELLFIGALRPDGETRSSATRGGPCPRSAVRASFPRTSASASSAWESESSCAPVYSLSGLHG